MADTPKFRISRVDDARGRPVRDLRISVTDRCNFRCPYCMPAEVFGEHYTFLPREEILTFEEIARLARVFVSLGVRKVRITGGEPLLRTDLVGLVTRLRAIDGIDDLTLTTNGLLLARHAEALARAGLDRVTVSLDSVDPDVFRALSGRNVELADVLAGVDAAAAAGLTPIKLNCVVQRGVNVDGIEALCERFRGTGHIVRFIEFMDVGTLNGWDLSKVVPAREILDLVNARFPIRPIEPGYRGEVARRYAYEDGGGEIGVIASVTAPFCGDCTRARLSTRGDLVTCLFANQDLNLRAALRAGEDDDALANLIARRWRGRDDRYSEERNARTPDVPAPRIEMFRIGG
ncbi:MAG: GTP 3',8-cyclase MoaA [Planctomycetes bacterium]|nr:GTP 3',8-cyclase MoaA [Planctomycetota bacterium]